MRMALVPGFTQTASAWDRVRAGLPPEIDAVALDVPTGLDFVATAAALGDAGGPGVYVGYSMGGRLALRLALDRPDLVSGLVLVSTSPGIADLAEREARRAADDELAASIARDGVEAFLERWLDQPLFATLPRAAAAVDDRAAGNTVATLTHALRALGPGTQEPLWDRLGELGMPVRIVVGMLDAKYRAIGQEMANAINPDPEVVVVPDAGHAVHLEEPVALARVLTGFHHELSA
jgi:2-succinyl-6-hydroxy-2,4-cyclohexadiene-1-carboxylate synthase